jgi:4-alpha-glucanotransferase
MKPRIKRIQWLASLLSLALLLVVCTSSPRAAQPSERQAKAMAMWQERCKAAGEKIYRTVEGVEGVYLMKLRSARNFDNQFKLDDPYGHDSTGKEYLLNFLQGYYLQRNEKTVAGSPVLGLGGEHRMNLPGEGEGHWEWRFSWSQVQPVHAERLARFGELYRRA